jgi:hypothetical protein
LSNSERDIGITRFASEAFIPAESEAVGDKSSGKTVASDKDGVSAHDRGTPRAVVENAVSHLRMRSEQSDFARAQSSFENGKRSELGRVRVTLNRQVKGQRIHGISSL